MSTFYKPTPYNGTTKEQMWMSLISDGHDIHCGCCQPYAHLLNIIFPEGHTDRNKPISEIIARDLKCHSGGEEEEDHGLALGASAATENIKQTEDIKQEEELDALLAAAAADAESTR